MINNIYLLHYNNYFNRQVKKLNTIGEYKAADTNYLKIEHVNFNTEDGVFTKHVVGAGSFEQSYNYIVVTTETIESDVAVETIHSRWFIIEDHRTRDGQYELVLRRDVIVDNYNKVLQAPIYIEKGYIDNTSNPLLYNSEGVDVNQIKQSEIPLMDETKSGWVVGYIPSDSFSTPTTVEKTVAVPINPNITVTSLSDFDYWAYCTNNPNFKYISDTAGERKLTFRIKNYELSPRGRGADVYFTTDLITWKLNSQESTTINIVNTGSMYVSGSYTPPNWYADYTNVEAYTMSISASTANKIIEPLKTSTTFNTLVNNILGTDVVISPLTNSVISLDGQIIKDSSTNQYWKIKVISTSPANPITVDASTTAGSNLINYVNSNINRHPSLMVTVNGNYTTGDITAEITAQAYAIQLENVGISVQAVIDSNRAHLNDAPYDMFCIPYSDELQLYDGTNTITCNKAVAVGIATEIGKDTGANNIYDVQLLPYCPNRSLILGSDNPQLLDIRNVKYDIIEDSVTHSPVSAIIWCTESTFSIDLKQNPEDIVYTAPFININDSTLKTYTYYCIPSVTSVTAEVGRCAISTTGTNALKVMWCRKSDGRVLESYYLNTIEITGNGSYIDGYTYGNYQNPVFNYATSDYNNLDKFIVFSIEQVTWGAQNLSNFIGTSKYPTIPTISAATDAVERKLQNECDLYRLVSNNYNGIFEFSVAKSGGIDGFIAECTYKPWAPYIHILPRLKGLYGDRFVDIDDARGLICGGDYSLPQLSNEWSNYQLQNKTYQDMFDRQIKNMDINNKIARQEAIISGSLGAVNAGISGGMAGALAGGGVIGAAVGAAAGTVSSAIGAAVDYSNLLKRQEENRSYSIDMYNFNLQNIQAIPTSLTKTSALVYNTRIFPFVEYYTCTEVERQALRDKIKYNGMSVLAIGKLREYIIAGEEHFYKGQIIRLEDLDSDSHIASAIYDELFKGVYM